MRKLNAMKNFGMIGASGNTVALTELGTVIAAPESAQQLAQALAGAFLSIDVFRKAYEKFKGGILPEHHFLANSFQALGAPAPVKNGWAQQFRDGGIAAGLLRDEGGKIRVLTSPSISSSAFSLKQVDEIGSEIEGRSTLHTISTKEPPVDPSPNGDNLVVPFGSGRQIRILFPPDLRVTELKTLMRMLEVYLESKLNLEGGGEQPV
jgi:hypothetical protein